MNMSEVYSILNMEEYARHIRKNAGLSFADTEHQNLDNFISIKQVCTIIADHSLGLDDNNRYLIDTNGYDIACDQVREQIYEVALCRLAARGSLECAWDNSANKMIFWPTNQTLKLLPEYVKNKTTPKPDQNT